MKLIKLPSLPVYVHKLAAVGTSVAALLEYASISQIKIVNS